MALRAPHAVDGGLAAAVALEPVGERDGIQFAHVAHAALRIYERAHNRRRAQRQRVGHLARAPGGISGLAVALRWPINRVLNWSSKHTNSATQARVSRAYNRREPCCSPMPITAHKYAISAAAHRAPAHGLRPPRERAGRLRGGARLVHGRQLPGREEGLEAMEGRADLAAAEREAEVQRAHVGARVDERVRVLLGQQVAQHAALGHQPEQVEVAAEELRAQSRARPSAAPPRVRVMEGILAPAAGRGALPAQRPATAHRPVTHSLLSPPHKSPAPALSHRKSQSQRCAPSLYDTGHRAPGAAGPAPGRARLGEAEWRTTCSPISTWLPSFCQLATLPPMKGRDSYTSTSYPCAVPARARRVARRRGTGARAPRRAQRPVDTPSVHELRRFRKRALVRERRAALRHQKNWRALLHELRRSAGARRASCGDRPCMSCSQLGECALQRKGGARRARGRWAGARLVQQLHRRRQPGQAAAHDGHLQARRPLRAPKAPGRACSGKTSPIESQQFQCASVQMVSARRRGAALSSDR